MKPRYEFVDELNTQSELFYDNSRDAASNVGPYIIVQDDFYPDPGKIRDLALRQRFYQYKPPLAAQVGEALAAQYSDDKPAWSSTALLRYLGVLVNKPHRGYRYATSEVRSILSAVVGEVVCEETWPDMGDWWNGAFHLQYEAGADVHRVIHHHYREGDVTPRGWSGLVYLSPNAPAKYGTSIWREKSSGRCIASKGGKYVQNMNEFELVLHIENHFNRLVLFRENVLHRAGHGFGATSESARLIQTFFFRTKNNAGNE